MTVGRRGDSEQETGFGREDTLPGLSSSDTDPRQLLRADGQASAMPEDGLLVVKEFSLSGAVPRSEPSQHPVQTQDIYVRLENTIYGPLSGDELASLLASGEFTGYESASSDLQHWTPLIYHPRMNLTGAADPDATHALLNGHSSLPAASRAGSKIRLEDFADEPPPEPEASVPLAQIMLRPSRTTRRTARGVELPVYAEVKEEKVGGVATSQPGDGVALDTGVGSSPEETELRAQPAGASSEPTDGRLEGATGTTAPASPVSDALDSSEDVFSSAGSSDAVDMVASVSLPSDMEQPDQQRKRMKTGSASSRSL